MARRIDVGHAWLDASGSWHTAAVTEYAPGIVRFAIDHYDLISGAEHVRPMSDGVEWSCTEQEAGELAAWMGAALASGARATDLGPPPTSLAVTVRDRRYVWTDAARSMSAGARRGA